MLRQGRGDLHAGQADGLHGDGQLVVLGERSIHQTLDGHLQLVGELGGGGRLVHAGRRLRDLDAGDGRHHVTRQVRGHLLSHRHRDQQVATRGRERGGLVGRGEGWGWLSVAGHLHQGGCAWRLADLLRDVHHRVVVGAARLIQLARLDLQQRHGFLVHLHLDGHVLVFEGHVHLGFVLQSAGEAGAVGAVEGAYLEVGALGVAVCVDQLRRGVGTQLAVVADALIQVTAFLVVLQRGRRDGRGGRGLAGRGLFVWRRVRDGRPLR